MALAASLAGIHNQFVQDDLVLIVQNARVHDLANWREILTSPYWPPPWAEDLYRPLTALLHTAVYQLGGGQPLVFRVVSYLLYAATAAAVLTLARRLLPRRIAIGAALLFAAHPVHVEAVGLGVAQNELLVGLIAVAMVNWYLDRRRGGGTLGYGDWALLGALYLAAGFLKEHALVLPGLLLGAELLLIEEPGRGRLRRLAPGYAWLTALGLLVLLVRTAVLSGHLAAAAPAEALRGLSTSGRALTMLQVVPQWARLLLWPAHLQADYSPREIVASSGLGFAEAFGLALGLGVIGSAWLARRRAPLFSFGITWLAVALLPVSNLLVPTGIVLAERTLFLPSIGLVLAAGGALAALWHPPVTAHRSLVTDHVPLVTGHRSPVTGHPTDHRSLVTVYRSPVTVYWFLVTALVAAGVMRSAERQRVWQSEKYFSIRSAEDAPLSYRTQKAYGYVLFESGRRDLAIATYERAIALAPAEEVWRVRNDLARRYFEEGDYAAAVNELRASLASAPNQEETRNYLILAYLALGDYPEAARQADSALARGLSVPVFGELRALADSAERNRVPPGRIRIRVRR